MQIRRQTQNFQDVNYNFQLIDRLLRGHGLDGDHIRVIPGEKVEGLQELVDDVKGEFGNLGELAYSDAVQKAQLGTTIIAGGYIVTGLIDASRISVGTLEADRIRTRSISTDKITIGGVTYDNLADYAVGEDKIGNDAISARTIQAGAVVADHILAGAITTPKIEAGAVQADKIQSGSIETYHISATGISADAISAGTIDASVIDVIHLNADHITSGNLLADRIHGGTLSGIQIYVYTDAYVGDTLYLGTTSNTSGKMVRFSNTATISNSPVAEDIRISARAINFGGNIFCSGYVYFDNSSGAFLPTRNAGSSSRSTDQFTMPYWTGNMCYIDLHSSGITVRNSSGSIVGTISFD